MRYVSMQRSVPFALFLKMQILPFPIAYILQYMQNLHNIVVNLKVAASGRPERNFDKSVSE